jgi:hypothetical protein
MKLKKLAIITTIIGVGLLGGGVGVFADAWVAAESTNNTFIAKVYAQNPDGDILISDVDELNQTSVSESFYAMEVSAEEFTYAGFVTIKNNSDEVQVINLLHQVANEWDEQLCEDYIVRVERVYSDSTYQLQDTSGPGDTAVYEGPLSDLGEVGDALGLLNPNQYATYHFSVMTARQFVEEEPSELNFNIIVTAWPQMM